MERGVIILNLRIFCNTEEDYEINEKDEAYEIFACFVFFVYFVILLLLS